jgi:tRNA(fMet)-specific endonuclease VapC
MLHFGSLAVSVVTLGELFAWAKRRNAPAKREVGIRGFLRSCTILDADMRVGEQFGLLRADLLDRGIVVGELDVFIAATALIHNLTLVTHNTADYQHIPNLQIVDWLLP